MYVAYQDFKKKKEEFQKIIDTGGQSSKVYIKKMIKTSRQRFIEIIHDGRIKT